MQVQVIFAVLGLSYIQCDAAPPQQLRGIIAKKPPGKFDWADQMPMRFAECEKGIEPGTFSSKRKKCGVDAECCTRGGCDEGGARAMQENYGCDDSTITDDMKLSANQALAIAKASDSFPIKDDLTVDSIQACCHVNPLKPGDGAHFTVFANGDHSHRDCTTGEPKPYTRR